MCLAYGAPPASGGASKFLATSKLWPENLRQYCHLHHAPPTSLQGSQPCHCMYVSYALGPSLGWVSPCMDVAPLGRDKPQTWVCADSHKVASPLGPAARTAPSRAPRKLPHRACQTKVQTQDHHILGVEPMPPQALNMRAKILTR